MAADVTAYWMLSGSSASPVSLEETPRLCGPGVAEFIAAMRAAWGPDPVSFEGRHYRIPTSMINPKPLQEDRTG